MVEPPFFLTILRITRKKLKIMMKNRFKDPPTWPAFITDFAFVAITI